MSGTAQHTQSDQQRDTKTRFDWQVLFDGYPSILTYRKDELTPRADGKLVPKYETVQRAPTPEDFERHFRGEVSLGRSPLRKDGLVTFGAIDIDIYQARDEVLEEIKQALKGSQGVLFRSKSRALQFYMFSEPVAAQDMVDALDYVRSKLPKKHRAKAKELFPKQTDPDETATPSAINLPMFGAEREAVHISAGKTMAGVADLVDHQAIGEAILTHIRLTADDVRQLAERNRARRKGGRPVREVGPVGFKEPKDAEGRQHFLFSVGSSMRARGADMDEIKEQLVEMDRHYAEIGHPIWEGKGRLEPARIESALKSISKFEQGTPSDLHYSKVEEFNEEFAIVDLNGRIEVLDCNSKELKTWAWGDFTKKTANRRVRVGSSNPPIASLWITDIDRREYSGIVIEPTDYAGKGYNLWRGFEVEPVEGDPAPFLWYVEDVLCNGDKKAAKWIIQYLADAVQRPTEPSPPSALALRGPQGHGKSILTRLLQTIFGRGCREIASSDRLFAQFNRPIAGCPIVVAEESIFSGDVKLAALCKTFISSPVWDYEEKFRAVVTMKNVHRLIAITNSEHAVHIDNDDRRWTVIEVPKRWDASTEEGKSAAWDYLDPMYQFLRGDGPAIVLHYLLNVEVNRQLVTHGYTNEAKARDKIMSDPVLQFLHEAAETLTLPHDRAGSGVASVQSIVEDVRRRSPAARFLSPEAVSHQIGSIVEHAERVRTARYVERYQIGPDGTVEFIEKSRQRGLKFGTPDEFRAAVTRKTLHDYGTGEEWNAWSMSRTFIDPPLPPSDEEIEALIRERSF